MEFRIEEFAEQHLALKDSLYATLENLAQTLFLDMDTTKALVQKMHEQWSVMFVAVSDEHGIIGSTTLLVEQKLIRWGAIAGHIEDVATRTWFTGHGVSKQLLEKAIQTAKDKWCYKIILDCEPELVPMYEKYGFTSEWAFMRLYLKKH